jgi:DNA-binding XRE family transcriptional regulator
MSTVRWEDVKGKADEYRKANDLRVLSREEKRAEMDRLYAEVRAYRLAEVRRAQELTQREIAATMGVSPPRVSAIEHGEVDRTELATLRSYIEALGGRLRVVADFGDVEYTVA